MRHIPNLITSLNLAAGFAAIISIFNGNPISAAWIIIAAMIFDFLDGFASRLLKAYSDLGKELDSLADMVSFGVAPGLLIFELLRTGTAMGGTWLKHMSVCTGALFAVCAGLRLARFNIDSTQKSSFKGLPTPAAAMAVISIILAAAYSGSDIIRKFAASYWIITVYSVILSGLMVSRIPLLSLKFHDLKLKGNEARFILVFCTVLLLAVFRFAGIPLVIPAYLIISIVSNYTIYSTSFHS